MTPFGTYQEIPPTPSSRRGGQVTGTAVEFVLDPNPCCFATIVSWRPIAIGAQIRCTVCNNIAKAIPTDVELLRTVQPDPELGLSVVQLADGYAFHSVVYDSRRWSAREIEADLDSRSLRKDAIEDLPRIQVARQRPSNWFDAASVVVLPLRMGSRAVIGKLKAGLAGKRAEARVLLAEGDELLGVKAY